MVLDWDYLLGALAIFLASFVVSVSLVTVVLVKLPRTYFLDRPSQPLWKDRHPAVRAALHLIKNLIGACLIAVGIALSIPGVPGQGILTILIGVMLLDFPAKRRILRKVVSYPRVLAAANRIRRKFDKPPFELVDDAPGA